MINDLSAMFEFSCKEKGLASHLRGLLDKYDFDGILKVLGEIGKE